LTMPMDNQSLNKWYAMKVMHLIRPIFPIVAMTAWLLCGCSLQKKASLKPDELIREGWNYYNQREFVQAIDDFEVAQKMAPIDSRVYLQAVYSLAVVVDMQNLGENSERAQECYQEVIHLAPKSDLAAWSLLALARMKHVVPMGHEPDYEAVCRAYQEVIDCFPRHLAADEALMYQQSTLAATLDKEKIQHVLGVLERFIQQRPDSKYINAAYKLMAACYQIFQLPEEEVNMTIKECQTTENNPFSPKLDFSGTYWKIASTAEFGVGDFETARTYYRKLIAEYPTNQRIFGARQELKRMDDLELKIRGESPRKSVPEKSGV